MPREQRDGDEYAVFMGFPAETSDGVIKSSPKNTSRERHDILWTATAPYTLVMDNDTPTEYKRIKLQQNNGIEC